MSISYRSGSNRLTDNQIDNNFRFFTGSRSITGSFTLQGNLIPSETNFSLGSSEIPFKSVYLSSSITFISGGLSQSVNYPIKPRLYTPEFETYIPDSPTGPNLNESYPIFKVVKGSDLGLEAWSKTAIDSFAILPPSGSLSGSLFPQGINTLSAWWHSASILDNGGGFAISHARVLVGAEWLDRSRHYGTDGLPISGSGNYQYNDSIGWWQNNHDPKSSVTGKTSVIWDNTRPRLWQFSAEGGTSGQNAYVTYAQTNGEVFPFTGLANQWQTNKNKAYYYNLLVSGSAFDIDLITGLPVTTSLEPPPYDDGDIIVRMWNDNVPYWNYWSKLEYDAENVIYYNVSQSLDESSPNSSSIYYQSSINPGRIKLINNYSGSNQKWSLSSNSRTYQYGYDYNPTDPFISSSNLCLSLRMIAGPYVYNPTDSEYFGAPPTHVQNSGYNLGVIFPEGYSVYGSGRINFTNRKQYGQVITPPLPLAWANTYFYLNTSSLSPDTNENVGLSGTYPLGAMSSQMIWNQLNLVGSQQAGYQSYGVGYHYLTLSNPVGDCGTDPAYGATWTEIHPIIPLTTAHYPISASYFWITASYSNDNLTFRKPNDRIGAPSLFNVPFILTGSQVPTIYTSNDVLPDNRIVDLNNYDLTFSAINGETFTIDADPGSKIAFTGLTTSSYNTLIGYNSSSGELFSLNDFSNPTPYFYSTGSTDRNNAVSGSIILTLGEVYNYDSPNYLLFNSSTYIVKTAGKYYINVNGTLGVDDEVLSTGLGWWKVSLQVNGATVAEASAKQAGSPIPPGYGGLDLMYVGDFSINDEIKIISDTSNPSSTSTISNTRYRFNAEYLGV